MPRPGSIRSSMVFARWYTDMARLTFALNHWTAEQRNNGYWYYGDTYREAPSQFGGPHSSLASVTLMIAREMVEEILRRQARLHATPPSRRGYLYGERITAPGGGGGGGVVTTVPTPGVVGTTMVCDGGGCS